MGILEKLQITLFIEGKKLVNVKYVKYQHRVERKNENNFLPIL